MISKLVASCILGDVFRQSVDEGRLGCTDTVVIKDIMGRYSYCNLIDAEDLNAFWEIIKTECGSGENTVILISSVADALERVSSTVGKFELVSRVTGEEYKLPTRSTKGSAGYDFFSPTDFTLKPGETIKIATGIKAKMEDNWVLLVFPRSGHGFKYRVQLDNTVGVIDSDYYNNKDNEGEIFVKLTNDGKEGKVLEVKKGTAFCQGIFLEYGLTVEDSSDALREGGLGSTGM